MAKWIEIPARRVLEVDRNELFEQYDLLGEDGFPVAQGASVYRIVKRSNGKVFKPAEFVPAAHFEMNVYYLEEL